MKTILPTLCVVVLNALLVESSVGEPPTELSADVMAARIKKDGFHAFLETLGGISTPLIPSSWYVARRNDDQARRNAESARAFGELLARELDLLVEDVRRTRRSHDELATMCESLLMFGQWSAAKEGYGNILLVRRAYDVAASFMGELVTDLDYPVSKLDELLVLFSDEVFSPARRARILNFELGDEIFPEIEDQKQGEEAIQKVWSAGTVIALYQNSNGNHFSQLESGLPRDLLERNLALFRDEQPPVAKAAWTEYALQHKWHYRVLNAGLPANVKRLVALVEFRKAVGSFPQRPPYGAHPFRSDGLAAFEYAWRKHAESDNRKLYSRAWEAYDLIKSGNFLDEETCTRVVNSALNDAGQDTSSAVD